jgi:hypothetical protein
MIIVGLFIKTDNEFLRVDFFNDEKISLNSSIQNIADISKVTTDFSQSFTVPATKQNNRIFKHWYESSIDSGFNSNLKVEAYIELDTIPFRNGKIQLEGATVKNGSPENYSINFVGNLTNLKDKFAGKLLKDLTDNTHNIEYDATIVKDKIVNTTTSADVMFPLISSDRYWTYNAGDENINDTTKAIRFNELFPALRVSVVLNMIESQFGVNFDGSFLSNNKFLNAYLYMKNAETFKAKPQLTKLLFERESWIGSATNESGFTMNLSTDKLTLFEIPATIVIGATTYNFQYRQASFSITTTNAGVPFTISYFKNGVKFQQDDKLSTAGGVFSGNNIPLSTYGRFASTDYFECYIESSMPLTYTTNFEGLARYQSSGGLTQIRYYFANSAIGTTQTTPTYYLPINAYFPEIKIEDFFSGLLKMFNLTCFSTDGVNYTLERIDDYYNNGSFIDITKYIDIESNTSVNRVKTFKKINFEYEKSESIINVGFLGSTGLEYGSLSADTGYEGEEYSIKLPFEDLNFNNIGGGLLQVGYVLKSDLAKYVPKAVILYDYNPSGLTTCPQFYFNTNLTGGTSTAHTTYKAFGQETLISSETFSLNFGTQQSTLTNLIIENGLYAQNYDQYLANIFNIKSRLIKIKTYLPTSILTTIKLNDRLIIRDKRYIINSMNLDLTTGEVQFELLNDFRTI